MAENLKTQGKEANKSSEEQQHRRTTRRIVIWIIIAILIILVLVFFKCCGCSKCDDAVVTPPVTQVEQIEEPDTVVQEVVEAEPEPAPAVFDLSALTPVARPVGDDGYCEDAAKFNALLEAEQKKAEEEGADKLPIPAAGVRFGLNENDVEPAQAAMVAAYAKAFLSTNQNARILVEGYTCDIGGNAKNKPLSQHRAESVQQALINNGVPAEKIDTKWYGKDKYNKLPGLQGREAYRRVNITIE